MAGIARSWLGLAARWLGPGYSAPLTDLSPLAVPVMVVGHDACDGGGMTGFSTTVTGGALLQTQVILSSARGFALWFLDSSASPLRIGVGDPPSEGGPTSVVEFFRPLRDVQVVASAEPSIAGGGMVLVSTNALDLTRPIITQPLEPLWVRGPAGLGSASYWFFLEEGL